MEKTELLACPMTADEAIRILTESNELLVGQMAQLSELIGAMENAPERERESWYDSLDHCQREYDAVAFAIDHLRRTPSPDNKPLTLAELREMDGEPVWVVSQFLTIPTGWFLLHKNFYGKTIDLYGPSRVVCEDELLRCSTPLLLYRRPPENEAPPHD